MNSDHGVILVVEDEILIRMAAVSMAAETGYRVMEAADADEAIALLEIHPEICLVFTDIEMPGSMDGLRLAHHIRNRWPPVKLVIVSGRSKPASSDIPEGGMFFSKPYDNAQVVSAFNRLLTG